MRRAIGLAALAAAAAVPAIASPTGTRPPVRLSEEACPIDAQASSAVGHALIQYRVSEIGRVDQVRAVYSVVSPESAKEEFLGSLLKCVASWRYEPARRRRQAVAERLLAAFHIFEPAPEGSPRVSIPGDRTLAAPHLAQLRREKQTLAMSLLAGPCFRQVEGPGFILRADLPPPGVETLEGAIRRTRDLFEAAFPGAPAEDPGDRMTLHVFSQQEDFNQVVAFDELTETHVPLAGQYAPDGRVVYLSAGGKPLRLTARVVMHEVSHHLVHARLFAKKEPPFWLNEGIATFIENVAGSPHAAAGGSGHDVLAALERGLQREEGYAWMADPDRYLRALRDARDSERLPPVRDMMAAGGPAEADRTLLYGQAWILAHFLMTADGGAYRAAFRSWIEGPATEVAGRPIEGLLAALGMTEGELEGRLDLHRRALQRGGRQKGAESSAGGGP